MHMILLMSLELAKAALLYENESVSEFRDYCQPSYKFIDTGMQLAQLVVIFKHGDRAAQGMGQDWGDRHCVKSIGAISYLDRCGKNGLTTKGYEQLRQLGRHIQNYYLETFQNLTSITTVSLVPKIGISAARGVVSEFKTAVPIKETSSKMASNTICESVKKMRLGSSSEFLYGNKGSIKTFDELASGYCNDVPVRCGGSECNAARLREKMHHMQMQFEDQMERTRSDIVVNGLEFSPIAKPITDALARDNAVTLLSGETSTIYQTLNGLNIPFKKIPSYGAAIFIEDWRHSGGEHYIRVVYNTKARGFGLYNENLMRRSQFMKYLSVFSYKTEALKELCYKQQSHHYSADIRKTEANVANLFENDARKFADFVINETLHYS